MHKNLVTPKEAREQASEYVGLLASVSIRADAGDEVFEIPNPIMLDDEQQQRYDQLRLETESWDRAPDTTDAVGNTYPGRLLEPYRKNGKLVESYNVQLAKAIFGESTYKRFKEAGGRATDVALVWWQMETAVTKKRAEDPKSQSSDS